MDEIFLGKGGKFLTVVSNLETGEPVWVGRERKRETLDRDFAEALPRRRRRFVRAVCVDMWEPFGQSLRGHLPHARIVSDKFHVLRHASEAVDETRRAEFFRKRGEARALVRGKRWLLLRSWTPLAGGPPDAPRTLRPQPAAGQGLPPARSAHPALDVHLRGLGPPLSDHVAAGPALAAAEKLGRLLTRHLDGILNYCHEKVPFGTVEAINGNIRAMLRRGRGYRDHEYLLLKVQRATATRRLQQAA